MASKPNDAAPLFANGGSKKKTETKQNSGPNEAEKFEAREAAKAEALRMEHERAEARQKQRSEDASPGDVAASLGLPVFEN